MTEETYQHRNNSGLKKYVKYPIVLAFFNEVL